VVVLEISEGSREQVVDALLSVVGIGEDLDLSKAFRSNAQGMQSCGGFGEESIDKSDGP
jgi:hypothetical protein